ncbi:MAG: hypothetical protein V4598_07325 [Bdellovibrionota bacterium]
MKGTFSFLILLISFVALAHEECEDPRLETIPSELDQLHRYISWNSASSEQITNAHCKTTTVPGLPDLQRVIAASPPGQADADIHGVRITGENPRLVEAFRNLTTMRNTLGSRLEPSAQVNIQAQFEVNPACSKVLCAVEKIWGPTQGQKILFAMLRYGVNTSELSIDNTSRFNDQEMNDLLLALGDVPPELRNWVRTNQPFVHYERGQMPFVHQGTKTQADSGVMFYDQWTTKPSANRQYVAFHEIAHNISRYLGNLDNSPAWLSAAGWTRMGDNWTTEANFCAVSKYGSTDPDEDFAETVSAYRYNGNSLKTRCPAKYQYMKEQVFRNREYVDGSCAR